jgi:hypothetical protein
MRKMLLIPLIVCMVALLPTLWMPTVHAAPPISVEGTISWWPSDIIVTKLADGNVFISAVAHETFTGTFEGTAEDPFTMVLHPDGFYTGSGRPLFIGEVNGKEGTLEMMWTGNNKKYFPLWWFETVILSGTGELANLRGQWTGIGSPDESVLSGKIVFAGD